MTNNISKYEMKDRGMKMSDFAVLRGPAHIRKNLETVSALLHKNIFINR